MKKAKPKRGKEICSKVVEPSCYQVYILRCYLELLHLALGAVFSTNDPGSKIPSL